MEIQLKLQILPHSPFGGFVAGGEIAIRLQTKTASEDADAASFVFQFENPLISLFRSWTNQSLSNDNGKLDDDNTDEDAKNNDNQNDSSIAALDSMIPSPPSTSDGHHDFEEGEAQDNTLQDEPSIVVIPLDGTQNLFSDSNEHKSFASLLQSLANGLQAHQPELCEDCVNGTYFLKDVNGKTLSVFKPFDEQGDSQSNPKRKANVPEVLNSDEQDIDATDDSRGLNGVDDESNEDDGIVNMARHGIQASDAVFREVAAYLLDAEKGFFGVPKTILAAVRHSSFSPSSSSTLSSSPISTTLLNTSCCSNSNDNAPSAEGFSLPPDCKFGSLQEFVENDGASWDVSPSLFPVHEVHKIGILDLILFNTDRHGGNILYREEEQGRRTSYTLIPIDHGFSLPESLSGAWFDWLTWPQAKKPFDADCLSYIENINVEEDIRLLKNSLAIEEKYLRVMRISANLLKKAAAKGLCLYDIATVVCRQDMNKPSALEVLCQTAIHNIGGVVPTESAQLEASNVLAALVPGSEMEEKFYNALWTLMDEKIDQLVASPAQLNRNKKTV